LHIRWQLKQNEKEKTAALAPKPKPKPKKEDDWSFSPLTQKKEKKEEDWSFESNNKSAEKKESLLDNPTNKVISELKNMPGAISRLPNLLDDYRKASSGDFRTRKSDVPKNWGKETEKALNKALDDGRIPTRNLKDS